PFIRFNSALRATDKHPGNSRAMCNKKKGRPTRTGPSFSLMPFDRAIHYHTAALATLAHAVEIATRLALFYAVSDLPSHRVRNLPHGLVMLLDKCAIGLFLATFATAKQSKQAHALTSYKSPARLPGQAHKHFD